MDEINPATGLPYEYPRVAPRYSFNSIPAGPKYTPPDLSGYATRNAVAEVPPARTELPATATGGGGGGFAPVSGLLSLGLGIKQMYDADRLKAQDTVPQELKYMGQDAQLRANSTLLPNQTQAMGDINQNATLATNLAASAATSPDQIVQAAGDIQSRTNNAMQNLSAQGAQFQQSNIDKNRQIKGKIGDIQRQDQIDYATNKALLREAGWRNIGGFAGAADQAIGLL